MIELKRKNVLITGAGGFIGSHLTERLIEIGCRVRAFVRYNSRGDIGALRYISKKKLKKVDVVLSDLRDYNVMEDALKGINIVFHLGALIAIPYSYIYPRQVMETNIMGTLNILMACRKNKRLEKVIHTSTSEVYGTALYVPIDEKHPFQAQSPYSASKIGADKIAESFFDSYNLPITIIRPFNTYGPRQSLRAIIPTIISQALIKNNIEAGSLTPRRDFTYVQDTVEAFIKIAESEKCMGKTVNIGSNYDISIKQLIQKISKIMGKEIKTIQKKERVRPEFSEVQRLRADNSLASKLIGWKPTVSIEDGLEETISWFSDNIEQIKARQNIEEYVI
ncbi:MAG: GDP-mannose 4,6-dehydratase [Candidatus Omnitrophica bacterium]|nr:GDP-mannose 4,6-dehydratase [Candidatus Omnitrophota bacterium]